MSAAAADPNASLEQSSIVLDNNITQLQGLYAGAGNAVASALETFKVFKPEIKRLDGKALLLEQAVDQLGVGLQDIRGDISSSQQEAATRMAAMEQRIANFEAFVAALPTWKEDLSTKIDFVGKESRLKGEQLTLKTNMLEDQQMHHTQATRERLDTLTTLAKTGAEARATQTLRIDNLEETLRQVETSTGKQLFSLDLAIKKHDEAIMGNTRHGTELNVKISMARVDIDGLKERAVLLEDTDLVMRSEIAHLRDRQDGADNSMTLAASQLNKLEISQNGLYKRIEVVERDPRIPRLMVVFDEFHRHQQTTEKYQKGINARVDSFEKQLVRLDGKVDRGPPGLWKVTEQVAKHAEDLAAARGEAKQAAQQIEVLERSLMEARSLLGQQRALHASLTQECNELQDRLNAGLQRGIRYTDAMRDNLAAAQELEALRTVVADMKRELQEGISAMGIRVKFDLLHDETPEIVSMKEYLQSVDVALNRSREKVAYLEEGLMRENARGKQVEAAWTSTKESLDLLILNGELDVQKLRKDLYGVKTMFEEMGKLSIKGDILTVRQAEQMIEERLGGSSMDSVLARKVHEEGPLAAFLAGMASKHEVEAVRKLVLRFSQELLPGGGDTAPGDLPDRPRTAGPSGPPAVHSMNDQATPLKLLYKRMATAEETAMRCESQCTALEAKVREMAAGGGGDAARGAEPAAPPASGHTLEASVREVISRTILPEVLTRQVTDTQHVLRFVAEAVERAAKGYEVEALRQSVATLRSSLEDLQRKMQVRTATGTSDPSDQAGEVSSTGHDGADARLAVLEEQLARLGGQVSELAGSSGKPEAGARADGGAGASASVAAQQVEGETRVRALEARLKSVEGMLSELRPAHPGCGAAAGGAADGPRLQQQVSDLQCSVSGLVAQQPLLAKAFEVEGVRQALAGLKAEVGMFSTMARGSVPHPSPTSAQQQQQDAVSAVSAVSDPVTLVGVGAVAQQWQERLGSLEVSMHVVENRVQAAEGCLEAAGAASRQAVAGTAAAVAELQQGLERLRAEVEAGSVALHAALAPDGTAARPGMHGGDEATNGGEVSPRQLSPTAQQQGREEGGEPGWATPPPRALAAPECADAELSGLLHDVVHAAHEELVVTQDGPLPGSGAGLNARNVREAALRRLGAKPMEVRRHVELLERAKKQLSRLVNCAAVSTVDHLCLGLVMLDLRVKLLDDASELHKEQMSSAFNNLETAFEYLRKLQEAVDAKATAAALAGLERAMKAMAREFVVLGTTQEQTGRDALLGCRLGAADFWTALLGDAGGNTPSFAFDLASPSRSAYGGGGSVYMGPAAAAKSRPTTARSSTSTPPQPLFHIAPLPTVALPAGAAAPSSPKGTSHLASNPHPPASFYKEKRNIQEEQERLIAQQLQGDPPPRQQAPAPPDLEVRPPAKSELELRPQARPASRSASPGTGSGSAQGKTTAVGRPRTGLHRAHSNKALHSLDSLPRLNQGLAGAGATSLMNLVPLRQSKGL